MSATPHIVIDALNLARGGGVVVMARLAEAFARAGWQVTVLASRPIFDTHALPDGVALSMQPQAAGALKSALFRRFKLEPLLKSLGAWVVLGFNYHSPTTISQATYHINIIPFLPRSDRVRAVGRLRAFAQSRAARRALNHSQLNLFESRFIQDLSGVTGANAAPERVSYIGIDRPPEGAELRDPADRTLVSVTSGAPHKRNALTLAAFRAWTAHEPAARLVFVGDEAAIRGSFSPADRALVDGDPRISFTGYLDRAALYARLRGAYALVSCSALESFFMVAVEAMAAGCPVVAMDATSAGESLGKAGLLVADGDVAAVTETLASLADPALRAELVKRGLERAEGFDATACADEFVRKVAAHFNVSGATR